MATRASKGLRLISTTVVDPFNVACKFCKAIAGMQCTNKVTGKPLQRALAHPCRVLAAEKAQEAAA